MEGPANEFNLLSYEINLIIGKYGIRDVNKALQSKMKEDYESEWWRAKEKDDFNLKTKLLRVGCRPLKRKLLACQKSQDSYDSS
jgi:hypothetical protein